MGQGDPRRQHQGGIGRWRNERCRETIMGRGRSRWVSLTLNRCSCSEGRNTLSYMRVECPKCHYARSIPTPAEKVRIRCSRCECQFDLQAPSPQMHKSERRKLSFYCAQTGAETVVTFVRSSPSETFRIQAILPVTNPRSADSKQNAVVASGIDARQFDLTGWRCGSCGHQGGLAQASFVRCGTCQRLVCGSKIIVIQNGPQTFRCAPGCNGGGPVEGCISSYDAQPIEQSRKTEGSERQLTGVRRSEGEIPKDGTRRVSERRVP